MDLQTRVEELEKEVAALQAYNLELQSPLVLDQMVADRHRRESQQLRAILAEVLRRCKSTDDDNVEREDPVPNLTDMLEEIRHAVDDTVETVRIPKEPSEGVLMSMAIRWDHALGVPGYYDQEFIRDRNGLTHADKLKYTLDGMRKVYEEVALQGFYQPGREGEYSEWKSKSERSSSGTSSRSSQGQE